MVNGPLRTDSEFERRLSVGAMIACRLRGAVREQLGAPGICQRLLQYSRTPCAPRCLFGLHCCWHCFQVHTMAAVVRPTPPLWLCSPGTFTTTFLLTGYTMSAGIACNKLLAKVAAGLHKPDQQTIVPPRCQFCSFCQTRTLLQIMPSQKTASLPVDRCVSYGTPSLS